MDAKEKNIGAVLTENLCYRIPAYQRPYSWTDEHASKLFTDIRESWESGASEYFIGSLITIEKKGEGKGTFYYEVVDGQQRLTTLCIILARIRDRFKNTKIYHHLNSRIKLENPLKMEVVPRLTLRSEDQGFFFRYILEEAPLPNDYSELTAPKRHIIENAVKIDELINEIDEKKLTELASFIEENVFLVFVRTESFDSAYRLFNVLNARGLSLSSADLIKGEFFRRGQEEKIAETRIERLWSDIESQVTIDGFDTFLSHHRTSLLANKMSRNLHEEYRPLIDKETPIKLLDSLVDSASNYLRISAQNFRLQQTQQRIQSLERMKHRDWIPPLLAFFNRPVKDLSEDSFIDMLERITMQNWVLRTPPSARLTVYHHLINAIKDGKDAGAIYGIFCAHANNDAFIRDLGDDFYGHQYAKSVLLYLESSTQDDMVFKTFSESGISIEHVLPQNMENDYWKQRFSLDQHRLWLNKIGNLTLISGRMNSSAKNYAFDRKREIFNEKARKTSFDMTKGICALPDWSLESIERRHRDLLNRARQVWCISQEQYAKAQG